MHPCRGLKMRLSQSSDSFLQKFFNKIENTNQQRENRAPGAFGAMIPIPKHAFAHARTRAHTYTHMLACTCAFTNTKSEQHFHVIILDAIHEFHGVKLSLLGLLL